MVRNLVMVVAVACAGCASGPTSYRPAANGLGYSDTKLDEGIFRVVFSGNSLTSLETTADYVLVRSAEVALANGFRFFVVSNESSVSQAYGAEPVSSAPTSMATIACYRERPQAGPQVVFDAVVVRKNQKARYGLVSSTEERGTAAGGD